jgi:hypothetical protein
MKYLKNIDFVVQSIVLLILVGIMVIASLNALLSGAGNWADGIFIFLYAQLILGPWQLVSSLLSLLLRLEFYGRKKIHFILSIICLLLLFGSSWLHNSINTDYTKALVFIFLMAVPWSLAIFYYFITWRWMFPKRDNGKFLSHISF